jgi:hypothetical protein
MRYSTGLLLIYSVFLIAPMASAEPTENTVNRKYLVESVTGEYIDSFNGNRLWISDTEMHKVTFEPIQKSNDPTRQLMMRQLINTALVLQPQPDEANVRKLLNKLAESGISTSCITAPAQFIAASPASRSAIVRFPNAKEDQVVDMLLLLSGQWSATYMAVRSKELARVGALPFLDAKESELGKKAPLEDLPFTAPRIIHRVSQQSKPNINWCLK